MGDAKGHTITPAGSPIFMGGLNADSAIIDEMGVFRTFDIEGKVSFDAAARLTNGEFGTTATFTAVPVAAPRHAVPPALRHWRKGRDSAN